MNLSIIIVNWNTRALLARCLESVYETVRDLTFEVFVVDNASSDGSAEMVRARFPQVRLIENRENVGFAAANNQAIPLAAGRYVLLLNPDTVVLEGAVAELVRFAEGHRTTGACGPRLLNADGSLQPSCHPMLTPWREFWRLAFLERLWRRATYDMAAWDPTRPREVEVIKGACLLLRREALDGVGLLDERYFMYSEEMDLCYRLSRAGWRLYWVPGARVVHYGEGSSKQLARSMYVELYRSKAQFYRKVGGRGWVLWFKSLLALAYGPRLVACALSGLFARDLAERAHTYGRLLATLPRM